MNRFKRSQRQKSHILGRDNTSLKIAMTIKQSKVPVWAEPEPIAPVIIELTPSVNVMVNEIENKSTSFSRRNFLKRSNSLW